MYPRQVDDALVIAVSLKADILVMGAYGPSRIRQFLVGSTTTRMLETARKPLVVLR